MAGKKSRRILRNSAGRTWHSICWMQESEKALAFISFVPYASEYVFSLHNVNIRLGKTSHVISPIASTQTWFEIFRSLFEV
jgi:hypothetical protein